jgi:catechol 2,3-dioxygenase-like lactoylglutathione lyase family enzyme
MLGRDPIMAFLATRDSARARRFYADVLGLRLLSDDPYALVFDAAGTVLRVQKVDELEPRPFTVLGWRVTNIEATVDALVARGVRLERYHGMDQDARGLWRTPGGARVAWFKDPDGNTLSLTELP